MSRSTSSEGGLVHNCWGVEQPVSFGIGFHRFVTLALAHFGKLSSRTSSAIMLIPVAKTSRLPVCSVVYYCQVLDDQLFHSSSFTVLGFCAQSSWSLLRIAPFFGATCRDRERKEGELWGTSDQKVLLMAILDTGINRAENTVVGGEVDGIYFQLHWRLVWPGLLTTPASGVEGSRRHQRRQRRRPQRYLSCNPHN